MLNAYLLAATALILIFILIFKCYAAFKLHISKKLIKESITSYEDLLNRTSDMIISLALTRSIYTQSDYKLRCDMFIETLLKNEADIKSSKKECEDLLQELEVLS